MKKQDIVTRVGFTDRLLGGKVLKRDDERRYKRELITWCINNCRLSQRTRSRANNWITCRTICNRHNSTRVASRPPIHGQHFQLKIAWKATKTASSVDLTTYYAIRTTLQAIWTVIGNRNKIRGRLQRPVPRQKSIVGIERYLGIRGQAMLRRLCFIISEVFSWWMKVGIGWLWGTSVVSKRSWKVKGVEMVY